jgi:DNA-binding LytR/AlgR family response regulator
MTPFRRRTLLTFEAHGLDYLVKPVDRHRLIEAVNGVKARLRAGAAGAIDPSSLARLRDLAAEPAPLGRIRVATRGRVVLVPTAQIDWIDGRGNYAILHLGQETACASASRRSRRGSIRCASCASTDRGS